MSTTATQTSTLTHTTLTVQADSAPSATTATATSSKPIDTTSSSQPKKNDEEDIDIYDEIEIEDMTYDATLQIYHYPCPCGDRFEINIDSLRDGEDIAVCPGCSLMIRVIFDVDELPKKEGG